MVSQKRQNGDDSLYKSKKCKYIDLSKINSFVDWNENTDTGYITDAKIEEGKIILYNSCN